MKLDFPKDLYWTQHSLLKLRQYNLSVSRIKRILRFPKRKEIGIAPDTIASMQPAGSKRRPYEIWVMYQLRQKAKEIRNSNFEIRNWENDTRNKKGKITIISVWRYPGISPVGEPPPIPEEVWEILSKY